MLHVLLEPRMGGPQLRILGLAEGLRDRGIDTGVILPDGDAPFRAYLEARGFPVFQARLHRLRAARDLRIQLETALGFPSDVTRLVRIFREHAPDVIHAHGLFQVQGALAARLCGIPLVWHLNDLLLPRALVRSVAPLVLRLADAVVTVSNAVRRYVFGSESPHPRIVTLYDPPVRVGSSSLALRSDAASLPGEAPRVLTVGNLYRVKGHADLVRAAAQVRHPATFLIAGASLSTQPEVAAEVLRLRGELSVARRVLLLGWREAVADLYLGCDLYVHPSLSEACPLAVLEAMAAGKAVVATAVGGVPELVVPGEPGRTLPGETGLLVPAGDPRALAASIDALLGDPARCVEMGRRAQALIESKFSLERCTARHAALYEAVAAGRNAADAVEASS